MITLTEAAAQITSRLIHIFQKDSHHQRPVHGKYNWFYQLPGNEELCLFYEYFHGDDCSGVGASHQTGWTALVVQIISV